MSKADEIKKEINVTLYITNISKHNPKIYAEEWEDLEDE